MGTIFSGQSLSGEEFPKGLSSGEVKFRRSRRLASRVNGLGVSGIGPSLSLVKLFTNCHEVAVNLCI